MYTGPRPKSKKTINLTKMRNQRNRELPQFEAIYVDRDVLLDLPEEVVKTIQHDFAEAFARRMRLRHFWTKKRFRVELFQEYDIDFNRYRIVAQERFYPPRRMTWQPADPSTSRPSSVRVATNSSSA